jgi:hypothetical protein
VGLVVGGVVIVGGAIAGAVYMKRPKSVQTVLRPPDAPAGSAAAAVQHITPGVTQAQPDWAQGVSAVLGLAQQAGGVFASFSKSLGV